MCFQIRGSCMCRVSVNRAGGVRLENPVSI